MTKIFKSSSNIFYLTQNTPIQERGRYSVILSPEFYWVKRVKLPVKKISAAKKLAESVYEGSLPDGEFLYDVSKLDNDFIIIAYDKEKIFKELEKKFIKDAKVDALYFAQNEFKELKDCCGVDQNSSLVNLNGLIMQVPRVCTESKEEIDAYLKDKRLSKHKISMGALESSVVDKKEFMMLAAGVILLFTSSVLDWINYKKAEGELEARRAEIIKENRLPKTSIQLKSIKRSLIKTFNTQKKIRDQIYALNSLSLQKGEYIDRIDAGAKEMVVVIKLLSPNREAEIKSEILRSVKIKSSEFQDDFLTIRLAS